MGGFEHFRTDISYDGRRNLGSSGPGEGVAFTVCRQTVLAHGKLGHSRLRHYLLQQHPFRIEFCSYRAAAFSCLLRDFDTCQNDYRGVDVSSALELLRRTVGMRTSESKLPQASWVDQWLGPVLLFAAIIGAVATGIAANYRDKAMRDALLSALAWRRRPSTRNS